MSEKTANTEPTGSTMQVDTPVVAPGSPTKRRLDAGEASTTDAAPAAAPPAAEGDEHRQKRSKTENGDAPAKPERIAGVAMIKAEYLINASGDPRGDSRNDVDDDAAEGRGKEGGDARDARDDRDRNGGGRKNRKKGGQNKDRDFGRSRDAVKLCNSVSHSNEFSPKHCNYGENCRCLHDLRKYLDEGRRGDLETFDGKCPVFVAYGRCPSGWKCRFVKSHMKEVEHEDGRKELTLIEEVRENPAEPKEAAEKDGVKADSNEADDARPGVYNVVSSHDKQNMTRRRFDLSRSEQFIKWLDTELNLVKKIYNHKKRDDEAAPAPAAPVEATPAVPAEAATEAASETAAATTTEAATEAPAEAKSEAAKEDVQVSPEDYRAQFIDPPFLPSEKRRIYFGPETPTLAPLTTQGNLPFRRLCVELGCEVTYSEMALATDMVTGKQPEWALMKAHESEISPPRFTPGAKQSVVRGYDNSRDLKFGAQIAANQPWQAIKATEAMSRLLPHLRLVDMNCGCPIDLIYKTGGGSGLLEAHNKLERMIRGMNAVSGEVPITAKIRIGVRDGYPTAPKVIEHLVFGGPETRERIGAPGCAAITLHGRTRNQRYKKPADWSYIAECATLIKSYNAQRDELADTIREPDARTQANTHGNNGHIYFLGNGDCYSHTQYQEQIEQSGVDSVMIGRGAIIKPWLFEEIQTGQYLDKSATERLAYIEKFARYGMDAWGTDEFGLGTTRRFLLEYLSFATRYVPIGILEHLPPTLNDRPPAFRGRNELETMLSSRNYKDWIKISEMFLGPAHPDFKFIPKHKSNAYEIEAEG